ncbi:MAG: hypothetical protein AAB373_01955 [Patescibacteria group bacterium]
MKKQIKILALVLIFLAIIATVLLLNKSTGSNRLQGRLLSKTDNLDSTVKKAQEWIDTIPNEKTKKLLSKSLAATLGARELDQYGNIIQEINGEPRTFLGYPFEKALYLESINQTPWAELERLKKLSIPKAKSELRVNPKLDLRLKPKLIFEKADACFQEEKKDTLVGFNSTDSICADLMLKKGADSISDTTADYYCAGIYKGLPILKATYKNLNEIKSYSAFVVPSLVENKIKGYSAWVNFCPKYVQEVHATKNKEWTYGLLPTTLKEVKKCLNYNIQYKGYEKWFDNSCSVQEICDNNTDDNNNGYIDCADAACPFFTSMNDKNQDAICFDSKRLICGTNQNKSGTIKNMSSTDFLCYENYQYKTWAECDTDNISKKQGEHGLIKKEGEVVNSNGCNYICTENGKKENWVGCNCNDGPDGVKAKNGELFAGYICNESNWVEENNYIDNLNEINPLFHRSDYNIQGFMFWSAELYNKGSFPLLPYLTPIKNQGGRSTCVDFADTAAAEIVLKNRPDLSEQNFTYLSAAETDPQAKENMESFLSKGLKLKFLSSKIPFYIGEEKQWPYNPSECKTNSYYSKLLGTYITCSNKFHQGIPTADPNIFNQYSLMTGTTKGSCVIANGLGESIDSMETEQKIAYLANIINVQHYPIRFGVNRGPTEIGETGFTAENFWEKGDAKSGHAMLIVGFVNKEDIPAAVKKHPYFKNNEHYFIVKDSWGTSVHDQGFLYAPASLLVENSHWFDAFKYDENEEVYPNCPSLN